MATLLYLARHGETVDNARRVMQGQTPGCLNEQGVEQARQLAGELAGKHFDAVVASDLRRAVQTARLIADPRGMSVYETPLLRERDWGGFTGRFIDELKDEVWPDDIETVGMLKDRARRFMQLMRSRYPGQTVLAVGHGIINKAIQSVYFGKPMNEIAPMKNAEVRILEL